MRDLLEAYKGLPEFLRFMTPFLLVWFVVWALMKLARPKGKPRRERLDALVGLIFGLPIGLVWIVGGIAWIWGSAGLPVGILFILAGSWFIVHSWRHFLLILGKRANPDTRAEADDDQHTRMNGQGKERLNGRDNSY